MNRTEIGLPAEQRTNRQPNLIEAIPGMEVCDFCTSVPVVCQYPCGEVQIIGNDGQMHATNDPWTACAHCRDLIEADDLDGLVERALGGFIASEGEVPAGVLNEIRRMVRGTQRGFFAQRQGDAEPV